MDEWRATVDGLPRRTALPGNATLAEALRDALDVHAVKVACGEGTCAACSVLVDGVRVHACLYPAWYAHEREVRTAASFADGPVARAIVAAGGLQCGFCTPGMVVAIHAAADDPTVEASLDGLREVLRGNLCRCTGYAQLVEGASRGLAALRAPGEEGSE